MSRFVRDEAQWHTLDGAAESHSRTFVFCAATATAVMKSLPGCVEATLLLDPYSPALGHFPERVRDRLISKAKANIRTLAINSASQKISERTQAESVTDDAPMPLSSMTA